MAPSVPKKKRKVNLPENAEVAARLFEKHRSMADQQPSGLPEHQGRALSAAYCGVCAAKEPIRSPGDLARLQGVEHWVVDVMEDSFPGSSLDLSPPESNTPGETDKKRKQEKPYVPRINSAAYAIVITLYREMVRGEEFMMRQELIDAAEASGLSQHAIGSNNSKSKQGNSRNDHYSFTGWNCMKTLTDKDLVVKKSNPAKYYLTEKGKQTARDCLARSGLDNPTGPLMATGHPEEVVLSDSDYDEHEGSSPLIGSENFAERDELPNSKAGSSISFGINKGCPTNSPLSSRGILGQQSFSAMGSAENSLVDLPPRRSDVSFLKSYEVVLILDDRDTFGPRARRKVADNIRSQFHIPVEKCGLRKLIYLVEGDPNTVDGSESVKTACFTTEILEGFDVQRTTGYADTEKKYGHLTRLIIDYYSTNFSAGADTSRLCLTYDEFVKRCSDLEKVTVTDIFALQLMQVPQVTEEAALAVTSLYPTLLLLAKAYNMLDGDRRAQEEMLKNKSNMVNAGASKNIFKLIWAEG